MTINWIEDEFGIKRWSQAGWNVTVFPDGAWSVLNDDPCLDINVDADGITALGESRGAYYTEARPVEIPWAVIRVLAELQSVHLG